MTGPLHSVLLYVSDLDASVEFYSGKLGFEELFNLDQEGGIACLSAGGSMILLHGDKGMQQGYLPDPGQRGRGVIIQFEAENVDKYYSELLQRGVEISREPQDEIYGLRVMYLYDPDGYNLTFHHRLPAHDAD